MAAMSDRLSRAVPFNSLKPFDRYRFADLVAGAPGCAAAHLAPLHRIKHALTHVSPIRLCHLLLASRPANRVESKISLIPGIPLRSDPNAGRSKSQSRRPAPPIRRCRERQSEGSSQLPISAPTIPIAASPIRQRT